MEDERVYRATSTAPVNIAVIKYWGKRDTKLNLPTNSSLSITLSQADLCTRTTASCSGRFIAAKEDRLVLNGAESPLTTPRTRACLAELRTLRRAMEAADSALPRLSQYPLRLVSENNFPTAAGLASSAAGFAALVRSIADLYELREDGRRLSAIARQGSGSACRSLFGGYVKWSAGPAVTERGTARGDGDRDRDGNDGSDSVAEVVADVEHWPDMRALIFVCTDKAKAVPSTQGMQATVTSSDLFAAGRVEIAERRVGLMEAAIRQRDFDTFASLTMRDSNTFHATCLDTDPPIFYMTDVSRAVVSLVNELNDEAATVGSERLVGSEGPAGLEGPVGQARPRSYLAAYTFDAGPNAVVYYQSQDTERVASVFKGLLAQQWQDSKAGAGADAATAAETVQPGHREWKDGRAAELVRAQVSRLIATRIGPGPQSLQEHLLDENGELVERL